MRVDQLFFSRCTDKSDISLYFFFYVEIRSTPSWIANITSSNDD